MVLKKKLLKSSAIVFSLSSKSNCFFLSIYTATNNTTSSSLMLHSMEIKPLFEHVKRSTTLQGMTQSKQNQLKREYERALATSLRDKRWTTVSSSSTCNTTLLNMKKTTFRGALLCHIFFYGNGLLLWEDNTSYNNFILNNPCFERTREACPHNPFSAK